MFHLWVFLFGVTTTQLLFVVASSLLVKFEQAHHYSLYRFNRAASKAVMGASNRVSVWSKK